MRDALMRNLVRPLIARAGTAVATYMLTVDYLDGALVNEFVTTGVAFVAVGVDLVLARVFRKQAIQEAD